jgi:glycosyl transferase, family 25
MVYAKFGVAQLRSRTPFGAPQRLHCGVRPRDADCGGCGSFLMRPVQVISLERSPERRAEFKRRNFRLAYEFFNAIDGATLSQDAIAATRLFQPGLEYTKGAYGVALSHHTLWEEAIRCGELLTIAEDDAVFREDFADTQTAFLSQLPPGWDFVLWGWNFDSVLALRLLPGVPAVMGFDQDSMRAAIKGFPFTGGMPLSFRLDCSFGLPAYTISPAGARKFKSRCFPLADFFRPMPAMPNPVRNLGIDVAMASIYPACDAYVSFPPLVLTPNDHTTSTIQNGQFVG